MENILTTAATYLEIKDARLDMQKEVDALKKTESALKAVLLDHLTNNEGIVTSGKIFTRVVDDMPFMADKDKFREYVRTNNAFHLLSDRLKPAAVMEMVEAGETIEGLGFSEVVKLSVKKAT